MERLVDLVYTDGVASCMRYDGHRRTTVLHVGGAVVHVGGAVLHVGGAVVHVVGVDWLTVITAEPCYHGHPWEWGQCDQIRKVTLLVRLIFCIWNTFDTVPG